MADRSLVGKAILVSAPPPASASLGLSVGGAVALQLAIEHRALVGKLVVSSVSFHPDGDRPENSEAVEALTVDAITGTPMERDYRAPSHQTLTSCRNSWASTTRNQPGADPG